MCTALVLVLIFVVLGLACAAPSLTRRSERKSLWNEGLRFDSNAGPVPLYATPTLMRREEQKAFMDVALSSNDTVDQIATPAFQDLLSTSAKQIVGATSSVSDPFQDVPWEWMQTALHDAEAFARRLIPNSIGQLTSASAGTASSEVMTPEQENLWKDALTSVQCKGAERNRTCAFKNLYYNQDDGGFFVFTLNGTTHPDFNSVMLLPKWSWKGRIRRRDFPSLAEFRNFIQVEKPQVHDGLSLIYDSMWHFNIGYALWDGLYPAFLALREWGRDTEKFRSVFGGPAGECGAVVALYSNNGDGRCMSEGVFRRFGGGEFIHYANLNGTGWHRFSDSVAGSGRKGYRTINPEYELPGGRSLDGARLFRDRMYTSHGLPAPRARASSFADRTFPLRGILIHNKRYEPDEIEMLWDFADEISSLSEIQLDYVDYRAGALAGNFTKHLELIGSLTFHISGPGTAAAYAPLMPDGGVHLNFGHVQPWVHHSQVAPPDHWVGFLEEQWVEGVPYLHALYRMDPLTRVTKSVADLRKDDVMTLIERAVSWIRSDVPLPVDAGANLSPVGHVFTEYCKAMGTGCDSMLSQMNGDQRAGLSEVKDEYMCLVASIAEEVVFESSGWSEEGSTENNVTSHCLIDRPLLRKIRTQHFGW